MAVKKIGEKYVCKVCGNEAQITKVGGGALVCCGRPMVLMTEQDLDCDIKAKDDGREEDPGCAISG